MDDTIDEKSINKRFNAKESNYKTSAPIIGNSLESRIFASRNDINKIKELLTTSNIDLSTLNGEYIKSFNELYTQYNSMNEELKDIIEDFKNNIEYRKFSAEDSPFIFDKDFITKWDLSEDKTKFTLTNLTNDFLNKEIEFEFKVKNVGFYCRQSITNYISKNNINYTIKYYINDEEVTSFVREYKKEDYEEEIRFKVVFLISSISSEDNYINIDYNFFKQFATNNNDSKFYLTYNKLTDFFDINIPEEDQNVLSYSDGNKQITFKSGYENKTSEGIEDIIEEKDENITVSGNQIYSSYDSNSSTVEKTMDLQSNIDNEKIISIENHPLDDTEEVVDGIEIKGNEDNEDIMLTVKDRIIDSKLSLINMPNYVGKIEDQTDSSIIENNSDEFLENLEVKNIGFIDIIKEKYPLYSSSQNMDKPVNLLLPTTTDNENNSGNKRRDSPLTSQSDDEESVNLNDYMEVQEFNNFTRLIIKEPKYFDNYRFNFGIYNKFDGNIRQYRIDVKGKNKVYFSNYNGRYNEEGRKYILRGNDMQYITIGSIGYLQFPVERPITSEYIQNNGYDDIVDFIQNSSYWDLLSDDEQNRFNTEFNSREPTMTDEEKVEFLIELYNKYDVDNTVMIDICGEYNSTSSDYTRKFNYDKINKVKIKFRFVFDASINKNELVNFLDNVENPFVIYREVVDKSNSSDGGERYDTKNLRVASKSKDSTNESYKTIDFEITDQLQEAEIDFSDLECNEDQNVNFSFGFNAPDNYSYYGIIIEEIKVYVGSNNKMENIFVKNENIGSEEFKMIELDTPRINKLSFEYSKQKQNSEIIETEIEKQLINENQIRIIEENSEDTLNKNENGEYSVLISDTSKPETSFEIDIPSGNNKIEFEINPFSVIVIDEPIEEEDSPVEEENPYEKVEDQNEETKDRYMAFYLNDSTLPFLVIDKESKFGDNDWQLISLTINENIDNKIIVKLFNIDNYFENISDMPIIRNICYYNENTNEKIIDETDIEEMYDGISFKNGAFIIAGFNSGGGDNDDV